MFNCDDFPDDVRKEVMKSDGQFFGGRARFVIGCQFQAAHVVLKCATLYDCCHTMDRKAFPVQVFKKVDNANEFT